MDNEINLVVIVENADIDNSLAVLASCRLFNVPAVIVTGRPANPDRNADISDYDLEYSEEVRACNARRLKGLLQRHGYGHVLVFEGLIPPFTVVPHRIHVDEFNQLDLHSDYRLTQTDGSFEDARRFVAALDGWVDVIVGGPFGELWEFVQDPQIGSKLRYVTCQLGLFGLGEMYGLEPVSTMAGSLVTFNAAAHPEAMRGVYEQLRGHLFMVPTDITKWSIVGFDHPDDLQAIRMFPELVDLYRVFYEVALGWRHERIYPHDLHPVLLMAQLRGILPEAIYQYSGVVLDEIGPRGEILQFSMASPDHNRQLVTSVDAAGFMSHLRATVCAA